MIFKVISIVQLLKQYTNICLSRDSLQQFHQLLLRDVVQAVELLLLRALLPKN